MLLLRLPLEELRLLVELGDFLGVIDCERPFELLLLFELDALVALNDEREPLLWLFEDDMLELLL